MDGLKLRLALHTVVMTQMPGSIALRLVSVKLQRDYKSNVAEKLAILPLVRAVGLRRSVQLVTMETAACATDGIRQFV